MKLLTKTLMPFLTSLGVLGVILIVAWVIFCISMMIYGLYLAFSASFVLGIVVLLVEPAPFLIGAVMYFFHQNLAQMVLDFLNK